MTFDPQNIEYRYDAKVEDVIDGDTYDLRLRLGFGIETHVRVRLNGLDTSEIYGVGKETDEYQQGMEHRKFVVEWFTEAARDAPMDEWPLVVSTDADETGKFGRTIADVFRKSDGERLQDALVAEYDGLELPEDGSED